MLNEKPTLRISSFHCEKKKRIKNHLMAKGTREDIQGLENYIQSI